jgi:hypothetical protein
MTRAAVYLDRMAARATVWLICLGVVLLCSWCDG